MVEDQIVVREGDTRHRAEVLETYNHNGTYARVAVQPSERGREPFEAYVELPDNPETPAYKLHCQDCGHVETVDGREELVGAKDVDCTHESNATLLRQIHVAKNPSHEPTVTPQPA